MITETIHYQHQGINFQAYMAVLASNETKQNQLPAVMIAPAWSGRDEFACKQAERIADLGYVGVAIDLYGDAKTGSNKEENAKLMTPLMENRTLLQNRMLAALTATKQIPQVQPLRIAVIGFCFGGLCALDLARTGEKIKGVVSFHGLLKSPPQKTSPIHAKILALHGHNDPMVPPAQVQAFMQEMDEAQADWQMHIHSKTMHAFTNPKANDPGFGTVYNPIAEQRSMLAMEQFLKEIFNEE